MNVSLGMALIRGSKPEREGLGDCGVVVAQWSEHQQLKLEVLGPIPGGCPVLFSFDNFSLFTEMDDVYECSSTGGCYHS